MRSYLWLADFCRQVAEIEKRAEKEQKTDFCIYTGNLSARRDFTDVRDVVRAYCMLMEKGKAGETYNVGTGHALEIKEILELILSLSTVRIRNDVDPSKLRPVDVPVIEPDVTKLKQATGWEPLIPFRKTVEETLAYWRQKEE